MARLEYHARGGALLVNRIFPELLQEHFFLDCVDAARAAAIDEAVDRIGV